MSWEYVVDEVITDIHEMVCLYKAIADTWLPLAASSSQGLLPDAQPAAQLFWSTAPVATTTSGAYLCLVPSLSRSLEV